MWIVHNLLRSCNWCACVYAWTDGLEEDRYAVQSSSLASPIRSPQSYSPSIHLHQVIQLFNGFYSVQRGVLIFFVSLNILCLGIFVFDFFLSSCRPIWRNRIYILKTPTTTSNAAPLLFIPLSAPLLRPPLRQWFRATILLDWGHLPLWPRMCSPPQPLLQWTPGTQGALCIIIVEQEGWTCHTLTQTAILKPAC